ncbi:MAG: hypothetical protein Q8O34_08970 [Rhodocyclaceae bacterium]|nr:hypothetical protein [Rhodocyclaceae bacterium]
MSNEAERGTSATSPDLDWSQVRETVLMLELAAGQVDAAMHDSNSSVGVLTDTFTSMAGTLDMIDTALDTLPDSVGNGMVKAEIREGAREIAAKVRQSIIAFQFYDKLVQRLDHVCNSLGALSGLVNDRARLFSPQEWADLQSLISSKYTMIEERAMFDAVMHGMPVQEALDHYMAARMQEVEKGGGDVELF